MSSDFNGIVIQADYTNLLQTITDCQKSLAKMFDGTTDSNVPVGSIKYNSTNQQLEKWDGAAWNAQTIGNLKAGSVATATIADDAVTDVKIRLATAGWLRSRNAANSANLNLLSADGSDNTSLNAATSKQINLQINAATKWALNSSGHLVPVGSDGTFDIATSSVRVRDAYIQSLKLITLITTTGVPLPIKTTDAQPVEFWTAGSKRWSVDSAGKLVPVSSNTLDIGSLALPAANVIANNFSSGSGADTLVQAPSGRKLQFGGNATLTWAVDTAGHMWPQANGTYDLGTTAFKLRALYAQNIGSSTALTSAVYSGALWLTGAGVGLTIASGEINIIPGSTAATAGALQGYIKAYVNGSGPFKIPYYNV